MYEAPNAPFVVREFPLRPVVAGEVLVRVSMCTICGADVHSYRGRRPNPLPGLLGHEIIGIVEAMGDEGALADPSAAAMCLPLGQEAIPPSGHAVTISLVAADGLPARPPVVAAP